MIGNALTAKKQKNMKPTYAQLQMLVEYMEAHGDLLKFACGPRGHQTKQKKWKELTDLLNGDGYGEPRQERKWRQVWSDLKGNTKKKVAKLKRHAGGTGGGPALHIPLTDLEERVLRIMGEQVAVGMNTEEAGFENINQSEVINVVESECIEDWNAQEETSSQSEQHIQLLWSPSPTGAQSPNTVPSISSPPSATKSPSVTATPLRTVGKQPQLQHAAKAVAEPPLKRKKESEIAHLFVENDRRAQEYARERDKQYDKLESERIRLQDAELRLREFESHERLRQRDKELQLQAQWLEFMNECLEVVKKYFDNK